MRQLLEHPYASTTGRRPPTTEELGLAELAALGSHEHERRLSAIVRIAATIRAEDALRAASRRRSEAIAAAARSGALAT